MPIKQKRPEIKEIKEYEPPKKYVDSEEFIDKLRNKYKYRSIQTLFRSLDENKNGVIDHKEFTGLLDRISFFIRK